MKLFLQWHAPCDSTVRFSFKLGQEAAHILPIAPSEKFTKSK